MQRRKAQFADILQIEVTGEIVIGCFGPGDFAQRRQAHAVVQAVSRTVVAHGIGHGAVTFAAQPGEQRHHTRREIHRVVICGGEVRR